MKRQLTKTFCLLIVLVYLSGCLAVPRKVEPRKGDQVLDGGKLEYLQQSQLTKTMIIDSLGMPLVHTEDGRSYLYLFAWRDEAVDYHLFNPVSIPLILVAAMHGVAISHEKLPVHQKHTEEIIRKDILLIEFDEENNAIRMGVYEFPPKIPPSVIAEDWLKDSLPEYFKAVES